MADGDTARFHCPTCDKRYRWKAELAGRKVRCAGCEAKLRVPQAGGGPAELLEPPPHPDPTPEPEPADDGGGMYDLDLSDSTADKVNPGGGGAKAASDGGNCPNCNAAVKPGAVLCLNCGFNFAEGKVMQTVVGAGGDAPAAAGAPAAAKGGRPIGGMLAQASIRKGVDADALAEESAREHKMSNIYVPLILIGCGLLLVLVNSFLLGPTALEAGPFGSTGLGMNPIAYSLFLLVYAAIRLIIQFPILLAGIFITAAIFGNSYGTIGIAMLKLLAIALLTGASGDSMELLLDIVTGGFGGLGWMITISLMMAVFYCTAMPLLDMEVLEALVLFGILIFLPMIIMIFVVGLILTLF